MANIFTTTPHTVTPIYLRDATKPTDVVRNWHDDTHPDPWPLCMLQPCHAIHTLEVEVVGANGLYR